MASASFAGHTVLVIEDESLIALDIETHLANAGAKIASARSVEESLRLLEAREFTAAIVDWGLPDGDASAICDRLAEKSVPYVILTGYSSRPRADAQLIQKPADPKDVLDLLAAKLK